MAFSTDVKASLFTYVLLNLLVLFIAWLIYIQNNDNLEGYIIFAVFLIITQLVVGTLLHQKTIKRRHVKHLLFIPVLGIGGIFIGMWLAIAVGIICENMFDVKDASLWVPHLLFKPFMWAGLVLGLAVGGFRRGEG